MTPQPCVLDGQFQDPGVGLDEQAHRLVSLQFQGGYPFPQITVAVALSQYILT